MTTLQFPTHRARPVFTPKSGDRSYLQEKVFASEGTIFSALGLQSSAGGIQLRSEYRARLQVNALTLSARLYRNCATPFI